MTSKNLCFKLMKEDLKRRVWTIAWSILSMLFALVVPVALMCSDFSKRAAQYSAYQRLSDIGDVLAGLHSNYFASAALMLTAVIWAVSGYHYLHNSRKTDFYHSLPVKRRQLFLSVYLNGILVPLLCYAAAMRVGILFVLSAGIGADEIGSLPWRSMCLNGAYYCLIYTTVVIAMMMTGHVVVALLGSGVFLGYGPMVIWLYEGYREMFFHTLYESNAIYERFSNMLRFSSPLTNYIYALGRFDDGKWKLTGALLVLLVAAAAAILAYSLYRLRPSEAAGKAMAFEKTKAPIRILLTIPIAIASGMLFYSISERGLGWMFFGVVCGGVLLHCLMEIIYHFDFRKLFTARYQMVVCVAAAAVLMAAGHYDLYGYDSWYPEAGEIADASVFTGDGMWWISYGELEKEERLYDGEEIYYYRWASEASDEYRIRQMKLTDTYLVSELARRGAAWEKANRFETSATANCRSYNMCFRLTNGRTVYRRYVIQMDSEAKALEEQLLNSVEYKRGLYPVMNLKPEEAAEVCFEQYNIGMDVPLTLNDGGAGRLLEAFQKDMEEMTVGDLRSQMPLGTIQFRDQAFQAAAEHNAALEDYSSLLSGVGYYPVYPSFARTLALLEDAGVELVQMDESNIQSITIYYYYDKELGASYSGSTPKDPKGATADVWNMTTGSVEYDSPEDIRDLLPGLYNQHYRSRNYVYDNSRDAREISVSVEVRMSGVREEAGRRYSGEWTVSWDCGIDLSRLAPGVAQKYGLLGDEDLEAFN